MDKMRVLLIEDDEDDYIVTRRLLAAAYGDRLDLQWIKTYEEAVEEVKRCAHKVCLLDYRLGARNGVELLREVKAESLSMPIILMTGQGDLEVDIEAARAGAADYLLKGETNAMQLDRAIRYSIQQQVIEDTRIELVRERQARAEAEEANTLKDGFLAMATHELRSPLNAILGWASILRTRDLDKAMTQHALEIIEQSARTQSRLIEDILDTARITSGKLRLDVKPVILSEVIKDAIEVMRPAADAKNIQLQVSFSEQLQIISGDPDRLQQIIWNLLSNAIKFTSEGGQVTVELERAGPHVQITVSDTGKGIHPEFLPHIFERFSQPPNERAGSRRRGGLGLGLALARHLVELHGGTIGAHSEGEGKGASFTIHFPLRAIHSRASENGDGPERFAPSESMASMLSDLRVLLVDDEDDARRLVKAVLEQYGAQVTAVGSAPAALVALESGEDFDVVVSDIGMPDKSGYDLVRNMRSLNATRGKPIPAVALTAYGSREDRIRALSAGFQSHIAKPVEPAELAVVVASVTGRATRAMNLQSKGTR